MSYHRSRDYFGGEPFWRLVNGNVYKTGDDVECRLDMTSSGPEETRLWDITSDQDFCPPMYVLFNLLDCLPAGHQRVRIHGHYFVWDGDTLHEVELNPQTEKDPS